MTALALMALLAAGDVPPPDLTPTDPAAAMACATATDPRPTFKLTLTWPGGQSAGLWMSEEQAIHNAQRLYDAEQDAARAKVPWYVWVGAGVVGGVVAGYAAHALIGGGK